MTGVIIVIMAIIRPGITTTGITLVIMIPGITAGIVRGLILTDGILITITVIVRIITHHIPFGVTPLT